MSIANERFYPADAEATYAALLRASSVIGRLKSSDDYSKAATIATNASGTSWGSTMSVQVVPQDGGAVVRINGAANVRVNITAKSAEHKKAIRLFDEVSRILQGGQPIGGGRGGVTSMQWLLIFLAIVVLCVVMAALTMD